MRGKNEIQRSFPNEVQIQQGRDSADCSPDFGVNRPFPVAEIVGSSHRIQQVSDEHQRIPPPLLGSLGLAVLVAMQNEPAHTLQEVDIPDPLPESGDLVLPPHKFELDEEGSEVGDISHQNHRLEEQHEPVHVSEFLLARVAHEVLDNLKKPVDPQKSPHLPNFSSQFLQRLRPAHQVVGPAQFDEARDQSHQFVRRKGPNRKFGADVLLPHNCLADSGRDLEHALQGRGRFFVGMGACLGSDLILLIGGLQPTLGLLN